MYFTERSDWLKKTNTDSGNQKNTEDNYGKCEKSEFILFHYNFKFRILTLKTETTFLKMFKNFFMMWHLNMFNIESDNLHSPDTFHCLILESITTRRYFFISNTLKYGFNSCLCVDEFYTLTLFNIITPLQHELQESKAVDPNTKSATLIVWHTTKSKTYKGFTFIKRLRHISFKANTHSVE